MNSIDFARIRLVGHRAVLMVVALGGLIIVGACRGGTIRVPRTDDTPPTVAVELTGLGASIYLDETSADVRQVITDPSARFTLLYSGADYDGGIFGLLGYHEYSCGGTPSGGEMWGSGWSASLHPVIGSVAVETRLLVPVSYTVNEFLEKCALRGWGIGTFSVSFWTKGENYHGLEVDSAKITLIYLGRLELILPDLTEFPIPMIPLIAYVQTAALCWFGPGQEYEVVSSLEEGIEVSIIGMSQLPGWWIIDNPRFPGVACWVEEEDLEIDPDLDMSPLPEYEIPALPNLEEDDGGGELAKPSNLNAATAFGNPCKVTLNWKDNSDNESGFRIYRDGILIGTVGANVTTFTDNNATETDGYNYRVRAYNAEGESGAVATDSDTCFG